jgi:hypothetical protein
MRNKLILTLACVATAALGFYSVFGQGGPAVAAPVTTSAVVDTTFMAFSRS